MKKLVSVIASILIASSSSQKIDYLKYFGEKVKEISEDRLELVRENEAGYI